MKTLIEWPSPPSSFSMQHGAVHAWVWDYEFSTNDLRRHISLLSPDEYSRMQRFHFEKDRIRYAASHAIMRILLARYLDLPPSSISFNQNEFGKPHLVPLCPASKLTFNLSHTNRIGLLAIADGLVVGADVEDIRPIERQIAEHYFSAQEQAALRSLTEADWLEGFYNCWTRKEAILKAEGIGLNVRLDAFDVSLIPNIKAEVLGVRATAGFTSNWHLVDLRPAQGSVGALATNAVPTSFDFYHFTG